MVKYSVNNVYNDPTTWTPDKPEWFRIHLASFGMEQEATPRTLQPAPRPGVLYNEPAPRERSPSIIPPACVYHEISQQPCAQGSQGGSNWISSGQGGRSYNKDKAMDVRDNDGDNLMKKTI
jgi:hypothetical protein